MKYVSMAIIFIWIGAAIGYTVGMAHGASAKPPVNVVYSSRTDVYTVYMLKNCLKELRALKGGE